MRLRVRVVGERIWGVVMLMADEGVSCPCIKLFLVFSARAGVLSEGEGEGKDDR